ncbi:120c41da-7d69-4a60-a512-341b97aaf7ab [Sclerotinia trifoliorum]|uniref:120c41da-7d69-4a60-a512-341b97aaf7ab n=1 Tax=Sclerotinia trifoliorum TaxID=28548 RepID=A0A8H2VNY3_9HELO|nr:120c41da-7d69-4a60-a512-341b97aaf7ab [Sclerotinia trifoliorum]
MASDGPPRRQRKSVISFSTSNIGNLSSRGLGAASLTSPSQLVLGCSTGKLVRTTLVNSSSNIEGRHSPKSPTPRSKLPSLERRRTTVNHTNRALGDISSLPLSANPPLFAAVTTPRRALSSIATMVAGEPPAATQGINSSVDDWNKFGANLQREASNLPPISPTVATAAQTISVSNPTKSKFGTSINYNTNMGGKQVPYAQSPATPAGEALPTTNSEFPANTDADKQQWKAAVKANHPTSNPFNLSIPDRVHRRNPSLENSGMLSKDSHFDEMALSNSANAYKRMVETVEKANKVESQGSLIILGGSTTMTVVKNPFSGPPVTVDMDPNFDANFAEMMATLENSIPDGSTDARNTGGHKSTQSSKMSTQMRQGFRNLSPNGYHMDSDSETSTRSINNSMREANLMSSGNQTGRMASSRMEVSTQDLSSVSQMDSGFQTSMQSMNHSTTQQIMKNSGNQAEEISSRGQNMADASLGVDLQKGTHRSQSSGKGNIANISGCRISRERDISPTDPFRVSPWESGSTKSVWSTANVDGFSAQENPGASIVEASPIIQANSKTNMPGSSNQAPSTNAGGYPTESFTGSNPRNTLSVRGGYNMSFVPNMRSDTFATKVGPDTQALQMPSPRPAIIQNGTPVYGHTPNNSISKLGQMSSPSLNSTNLPARLGIDLRRSATPNQSIINPTHVASPAVANTPARSTRSNSIVLAAPNISFEEVSPNPLHPASFHRDSPRSQPNTPLLTSPNPLHPPSFHHPTPRAVWPTFHVPIPPNPAEWGSIPGYFQPGQIFNSQGDMNVNMDMSMHTQSPVSLQSGLQSQYNINAGGEQNVQMQQQCHGQVQNIMTQTALENQASERPNQENPVPAPTPPCSPPGSGWNNMLRQRLNLFETHQPLTARSTGHLRRLQVANEISTSLQYYDLNSPMPFDGKRSAPLWEHLVMEPRLKKTIDVEGKQLAINQLTIGENFECDFCTGKPNSYGIGPYSHNFNEIWGPAGCDWCRECQKSGKHIVRAAVLEKMDHKEKRRGKRPAKDSAGSGPSPKKSTQSSCSRSSMEGSRLSVSATSTSYDRYAPMSEESNVFGDPQEIFSAIDNILINPFMHNLMCRGSDHRQIDMSKTKICESCKMRKLQIITHGCHDEFSHIVALNTDGQWQLGYSRGLQDPSQMDGSGDLNIGLDIHGFSFDVGADLMDGSVTLDDINSIVDQGLKAGGMNSGGISTGVMQPDMDWGVNPSMNSIVNIDMDCTASNTELSWDQSGGNTTSSATFPLQPLTSSPPNSIQTHNHSIHMNGKPHGPISKFCMVCPAQSIFLCDGCPLTLCESCRYRLRDLCKGWFNNLIYTNGTNHNRNDAFLLRSDDGGYHEYGKFWPVPPHVSL